MSLANRLLVLALGAFGFAGLVPAQDLTLVYKETPGGNTTAQYFTKDRMRHNSPDQDSIFEYATGKITNIDHKKKEYYEVTLDEMEARMKQAAAQMDKASAQMKQQLESMPPAMREKLEKMMGGVASSIAVTRGGARKVAGYDCQEYTITIGAGVKADTCNTTALKFPVPDLQMKRFSAFTSGMANSAFMKAGAGIAERMKEVQGYPLAETTTVSIMGKTKTTAREAIEVKQGPVDPAALSLAGGRSGASSRWWAPGLPRPDARPGSVARAAVCSCSRCRMFSRLRRRACASSCAAGCSRPTTAERGRPSPCYL